MRAGFFIQNIRWLGAGFALTVTSSFGQTYFISLFAGEIMATYGLTEGGWGTLYTVATVTSAVVLFQTGKLADTVPLRYLALGLALAFAGVALGMALNGSVWFLPVLIFGLRYCGQGMMGHIAMTAMGRWFRAHRGRAVAVAGLGYSVGEAVLPAIMVTVVALVGWRMGWAVVAAVLALVAAPLLYWLLSETRLPQGQAAETEAPGLYGRHWQRSDVMRHWSFWVLLPTVLSSPFIGTVVFFHMVHLGGTKGWDLVEMALGYPVYAGLTVAASLVAGWLVDRFGPPRLLPVYLLPMAAGTAVLGWGETVWAWYGGLALIGLTQGIGHGLWGALWPELYGTRHLGGVRAISTTVMVFATAIGPGITGLLIDAGVPLADQAYGMTLWCASQALLLVVISRRLIAALPGRSGVGL